MQFSPVNLGFTAVSIQRATNTNQSAIIPLEAHPRLQPLRNQKINFSSEKLKR
jgi:hypothetical protein